MAILAALGLNGAGCAGRPVLAVPLAMVNKDLGLFPAKQYVRVADAHSTPDQGVARIVLLRPTIYGAGSDFKVVVRRGDQINNIGLCPPKTSLCFDEQPGEMEISISADSPHYTKFDLAGGKVHYLKFKPHLTWAGLTELDSQEGEKTLSQCLPPP